MLQIDCLILYTDHVLIKKAFAQKNYGKTENILKSKEIRKCGEYLRGRLQESEE